MRHVVVTRMVQVLAAVLAAASLVFAWRASAGSRIRRASGATAAGSEGATAPATPGAAGTGQPAGSSRGAELFARSCAACHELEDVLASLRSANDDALATLELLELLESHGATGPAEDRAIARYLLESSRGAR